MENPRTWTPDLIRKRVAWEERNPVSSGFRFVSVDDPNPIEGGFLWRDVMLAYAEALEAAEQFAKDVISEFGTTDFIGPLRPGEHRPEDWANREFVKREMLLTDDYQKRWRELRKDYEKNPGKYIYIDE